MTPEELYAWAVAHAKERVGGGVANLPETQEHKPKVEDPPLPEYNDDRPVRSFDTAAERSTYMRQLLGAPHPNVIRAWLGLPPLR